MKLFFSLLLVILGNVLFSQNKLSAYVYVSEDCPVCIFMSQDLKTIQNKYNHLVDFYLVFPLKRSNYKTIHQFKEKFGLTAFQSIKDDTQSLTKRFEAHVTPEVVLVDQENHIYYKGRINNAYYAPGKRKQAGVTDDLINAINQALEGKDTPKPWGEAVGCFITME